MTRPPSSPLHPGESKLQRRSQKAREKRQRLREQRRNDELASARLQKASQERQMILARYVAMTEEELAYDCLGKAGE